MKSAGQKTLNFKLAAVLFVANLFGAGSALACTTVHELGCGVDSATAYALSTVSNKFETESAVWHGDTYGYGVSWKDSWTVKESTTSPEHAMDNMDRTELIALNFNEAVVLDKVTLGWTQTDADFSLFAWKGDATIAGKTITELVSAWTLVGNYSNAAQGEADITVDVNSGKTSSSWWIISAYNSAYGSGSGLTVGNDYMKVLAVACDPGGNTNVPEPGSMILLGAGLFGIMALRRRRESSV